MRKLILGAPVGCTDFYALDIGAGNYQWGRGLAKYLNSKKDIPKDVTIHIIGIRGETNLDKTVTELGQCKLYEFGKFQVETLMDEFQQRGLHLSNKVDLIVSKWCFRHLVDNVGTFTQTLDLLRPKTGHLLIDGFFFLAQNERMCGESLNFNARMTRLCLETQAPFLTRCYDSAGSLDHFIVNKPDDRPCHLNRQYIGTVDIGSGWDIKSETVTRFIEFNGKVPPLLWEGDYRGDKGLYERLKQNGLLCKSNEVWGPLQNKDANKKTPPLHSAIAKGDEEAIARCLKEGCDINESDHTGATPLHLAIQHGNYKFFSTLLEKGALIKLFAIWGTPLHFAVKYDFNGRFVKDLIQAGANVNISEIKYHSSPLEDAIEYKNVKAVELLLEAKAIVKYRDRKSLDNDLTFSSIHHLLPKRLSELEGFDTIINHIQKGDCVILTYPDGFDKKFQKSNQLGKEDKLIRITVNPETRLLENENYKVISDLIDCKVMNVYSEDSKKEPHLDLRFGY